MSIVDKELERIERDADNSSKFLWSENAEKERLIALARELAQHCEAMSVYSAGHSSVCNCAACAYLKWKQERG